MSARSASLESHRKVASGSGNSARGHVHDQSPVEGLERQKTQRRKDSRGFSRSMSHNPATRRIHCDQVLADAPEHAHHLDGDLYIEGLAGARLPALGRDRTPPSRLR
jgi:hypothetical protein